jgi:hypothetical protein
MLLQQFTSEGNIMERIKNAIENKLNGRKLVVYGTGFISAYFSPQVERIVNIHSFISKDCANNSKFLGKPVVSGGGRRG